MKIYITKRTQHTLKVKKLNMPRVCLRLEDVHSRIKDLEKNQNEKLFRKSDFTLAIEEKG